MVKNLNVEFLNGKSAPKNGDLVSTSEYQTLSNKKFGSNIEMNKNNIINLGDPENDNDAVNKKYVDNLVSGLQSKKEVCCSTIENIKCKYDNTEETLTINKKDYKKSLFDNINLNINDSILVLNQDNKYENGIYYFNDKTKIVLKRRDDLNKNTEGNFNGYYVFCENGKINGNTGFVLSIKEIILELQI